ncbi:MAG: PD-(D/E)XK nuclease family protein [Bacteroidota bacterium]
MDNLNMLYVALTRPQYRLYLFSQARGGSSSKRKKTPEVGSQPDSIAKLLRLTLTEMMGEPVGEAPQQLRWGHAEEVRPIRKASETGGTSVMLHHNGEVRTHWNEAIRVKFYGKDLDARDLVHRSERQTAGQALHEALARVRYPKDIPQAVQQGVLLGEIPAAIAKEVEEELRQALANPSVESWFQESWEIKNEAELIQPNGMALRPDRVMVKDTHAVVVDYKSGATHSGHQHQVREYMRALQQMGYESVEGYVFYFLRGEVRKVSQN